MEQTLGRADLELHWCALSAQGRLASCRCLLARCLYTATERRLVASMAS